MPKVTNTMTVRVIYFISTDWMAFIIFIIIIVIVILEAFQVSPTRPRNEGNVKVKRLSLNWGQWSTDF